jgi:hypothetical protein
MTSLAQTPSDFIRKQVQQIGESEDAKNAAKHIPPLEAPVLTKSVS